MDRLTREMLLYTATSLSNARPCSTSAAMAGSETHTICTQHRCASVDHWMPQRPAAPKLELNTVINIAQSARAALGACRAGAHAQQALR